MSDPYFQKLFAARIGGEQFGKGTEIYKFEKIKRAKRAALKENPDLPLLDFGIGENDEMADPSVRSCLKEEVDKLENRGYADNGIPELKDAAADWFRRNFGVTLNPETEINHCIGSKTALAMLPLAFINPGDITLMTAPGYPVAGTYTQYAGGEVYNLPLEEKNAFLPDLKSIPADVRKAAKLLVINYPNNPTGGQATPEFYREVVQFAKENEIVVIQDAAHALFAYGERPSSFLEIDGARDVGVEIHSFSKGYHMIGWRIGFVAGNAKIVQAFADIKDNSDSGQFIPIQKAAASALSDDNIPTKARIKYQRRLEKLIAVLKDAGFNTKLPGGTYFLYTQAPKGVEGGSSFQTGEDASQFLIRERGIVTVPWDNAGAYLRFSVTYQAKDEAEEDTLMNELQARLSGDTFRF